MMIMMVFLHLFELDTSGIPLDTDGDGIIDAIDPDDDGDKTTNN
jgi:hypothetical protein